jgi:hypothetical protein
VHDARPLCRGHEPDRLRDGLVEHARAQAAADDEEAEGAAAPGPAVRRRRKGLDRLAHRVAGDDRLRADAPRVLGRGVEGEAEGDRPRGAQQRAVAEQQTRVGVDEQQRDTEPARDPAARKAHVAAHAEHRVGAAALEDAAARSQRDQELRRAERVAEHTLAAQALEADPVEHDPARRHELVLHA